ncbi:hypothetical protein [Pseudodesulfovibrio senegalensis]|uniref:STT3/PglB/AglB core domain-containing protein n=1 Tax=Pseudodesulfovibrio senegalensis TaxID=1721087 RepID=A0A6N6N405_9BACT|nr:hypothetical protein [Pseudodesulfovibrio senegalensis]KAB1441414.1 hypothetical protein F8A88_10740 [Pseudodesulfovibrio senegalensis]
MQFIHNKYIFALLLLFAAALIYAGLAMHHARFMQDTGCVYHGSDQPILANNDGWFYLSAARQIAGTESPVSGVLSETRQSMLMPHVLAMLAGTDDSRLRQIGFYLPVVLALFMVIGVLPWAMDTGSRFQMAATALGAALAPYWIVRTHAGKLDTDGLIPGLLSLCLYALYRFSRGGPRRWLWLGGYMLGAGVMGLWWKPGLFLVAGAFFLLMVAPPKTLFDARLRLGLGLVVLVGALLAAMGVSPIAGYLEYAASHARLALGSGTGSLLGRAIAELNGLSPMALGDGVMGSAWLGLLIVPGIIFHLRENSRAALFLLPTIVLGGLAVIAQRFAIFLVPGAVFFTACGVRGCVDMLLRRMRKHPPALAPVLWTAVLVAFLAPSALAVAEFEPRPYFDGGDIRMAEAIRENADAGTHLWSWWDYGYFLQYLTGCPVFFDGGSQTMRSCFMAAYPLVQADPDMAARWMGYFSANPQALPGTAWEQWNPQGFAAFVRNMPEPKRSVPVILCLPRRAYDASGFLYSFAHARGEERGQTPPPVVNHMDIFARGDFRYDAWNNTVVVPEPVQKKGYTGFGAIVDATGRTPDDFRFETMPDPYLVHADSADFIAVVDRAMVDSVLFRLLGLFSFEDTPFSPLFFEYGTGGAWRVSLP